VSVAFDLAATKLRDLNAALHAIRPGENRSFRVLNPRGAHAVAVGVDADVEITVAGHVGYYCAGHTKHARIRIEGNAGTGVAENMMSGFVHVTGDASQSAGASAQGGLLRIDGNAAARCGISLKGASIVVQGSVGHMSAFMAQAGVLVVFGDAGEALGDSIYEARLYVRGRVASLGADCIAKQMRDEHLSQIGAVLAAAGLAGAVNPSEFTRYGSARKLYNFHPDNAGNY
jgi:glutamate synthase domain-containing protein 3